MGVAATLGVPDIAVSAVTAAAPVLTQRLIEGTLDLAVMYRPIQPPGYVIEHLFDEEFVLVTSAPAADGAARPTMCSSIGDRTSSRTMPPPTRS